MNDSFGSFYTPERVIELCPHAMKEKSWPKLVIKYIKELALENEQLKKDNIRLADELRTARTLLTHNSPLRR